jgi:uncharacterized protein YjbI with pentapeptide repeats
MLNYAHLEGGSLGNAHLEGANLYDAHLEGASLGNAHLEGAYLGNAHLEGANLYDAHLEAFRVVEQSLIEPNELTLEQVKSTKGWKRARWSPEARKALGLPPEDEA